MKGILLAAGMAGLAFAGGRMLFNNSFSSQVKKLYRLQQGLRKKNVWTHIETLPDPVQRYLKKAINGHTTPINEVRLKHNGFFKTSLDKDWTAITGEQHYTTQLPGFVWKGKTSLFGATDSFIAGQGNLSVWLFSAFKIMNSSGRKTDQAELLRWLGEAILFPTVLVTNELITWSSIDDHSAKLHMHYNGMRISYKVTFNKNDEVKKMETERYYNNGKMEKWIGRFRDYKNMNGYYIPTTMEGGWILDNAEYPYAKFYITSIEYNFAETPNDLQLHNRALLAQTS